MSVKKKTWNGDWQRFRSSHKKHLSNVNLLLKNMSNWNSKIILGHCKWYMILCGYWLNQQRRFFFEWQLFILSRTIHIHHMYNYLINVQWNTKKAMDKWMASTDNNDVLSIFSSELWWMSIAYMLLFLNEVKWARTPVNHSK